MLVRRLIVLVGFCSVLAIPVASAQRLQASADDASTAPSQLVVSGLNTNQQLLIGYNTQYNYSSIQSIFENVAFEPLVLNAIAGNVGIGTTNPNNTLQVSGSNPTVGLSQNPAVAGNVWFGMFAAGAANTATINVEGVQIQSFTNASQNLAIIPGLDGNGKQGNVGIGTTSPTRTLHVAGDIQVDGAIYFGSGTTPQSAAFTGVLSCGDFAESVRVAEDRSDYGPGDILVIDPANPSRFLRSVEPYSTGVSGIYSTKPGIIGRAYPPDQDSVKEEVPMAIVDIVPAKASAENGPIRPGDLLVTSGTMGHAMKGTDRSRMVDAIVGKALDPLEFGVGTINVLVSLQ